MHKDILLVEDNADDVELTRIAFEEAKVANRLMVVRDGAEALDYIFARGTYADRDPGDLPSIVLLEVQPTSLHQRVPVFLGSKKEVETAVKYHADHHAA